MAKALWVTPNDIKKFTAANGNIDDDKIIPFMVIAQDVHIQNYLGSPLYDKIAADIVASTLTGVYLTLVTDYIKPMLMQWGFSEYMPWAAYSISNKGVYKHGSENSESVEKNEVDFLVQNARSVAEHYTERFIKHVCNNSSLYPEYNQSDSEDMSPDRDVNTSGWNI